MPVLNAKGLVDTLVEAIQRFQKECGQTIAQLDVSGGVDSAVMLCLLSKALPKENIVAVYSDIYSSMDSENRAKEVAAVADVKLHLHVACDMYDDLVETIARNLGGDAEKRLDEDPTIGGSIRSTLRAPIGRAYNRMAGGGIRYGTGNECEDRFLRFYQKGGDGEVDCNPLASLSKGEVFQLAHELGVPESIKNATPSPDLWGSGEAHNDEDELLALTGVEWTYSKVVDGKYTYVGTIERMARWLDENGEEIFSDDCADDYCANSNLSILDMDDEEALKFMQSAAKTERSTRHKAYPNCPSLVDRIDLLRGKLITNDLPS